MYISELSMENFRCFPGITHLKFSERLNYFVGDNNCGKTTVFRAIEFILSAKTADGWRTKGEEDAEVSVEIVLKGKDLSQFLRNDDLKKYLPFCQSMEDGDEIRIRRSSRRSVWKDQKGKEKEISIRNVAIWNPETKEYENPTGADTMISALFDAQFVYSDLNNEEYRDFSKTKIVGKLINEVTESFQQTDAWKQLRASHEVAFGDEGLVSELRTLQQSIEDMMRDQYGSVKVEFNFGLPTIDNFFKTGQILLEDNGIKTDVSEKGTGMQRALAISLIQVYAHMSKDHKKGKPIFFFLDEPETFLHPRAQDKLISSLETLAETSQTFITTHSPYLLKNFKSSDNIKIFRREEGAARVQDGQKMNLFPYSPSWGEINYFAFGVVSEEFHIELFGLLHKKVSDLYPQQVKATSINSIDAWLSNQSEMVAAGPGHVNRNDRTMTTYIRNWLDHPGNNPQGTRPKPTREEIRDSIVGMLKILERL